MTKSTKLPPAARDLVDTLVIANRILFDHDAVDAFGHISVRHDKDLRARTARAKMKRTRS